MLGWVTEVSATLLLNPNNCVGTNDIPVRPSSPGPMSTGLLCPSPWAGLLLSEQWSVVPRNARGSEEMLASIGLLLPLPEILPLMPLR